MKGWNLKVTSLEKRKSSEPNLHFVASILNFRAANRSWSWKILNYVQIWHLVKEKKYWIIWSNNLVKHGLTILRVLHWNQLSFSPWPSVGQPPVRCQVVCVFFLVGDSVPFLASETNKSSCHEKMFWLLKPTNFWFLTQSVPPPHHVASSTSCVAPGMRRCDLCISNIYTVTKMMKTMMPSVYNTKTSKTQVHPKHVQMICKCIGMSPSRAFKMRCLAIFAKSLGPTCEKVWDEVQPQIADKIVDGRNPANQLIWRI